MGAALTLLHLMCANELLISYYTLNAKEKERITVLKSWRIVKSFINLLISLVQIWMQI